MQFILRILGLFFLGVALVGCGGGGGSASDPPAGAGGTAGTTGTTGAAATSTGMIPPAPSTGATLQRDATLLRPARAGYVWTYAGTVLRVAGATPVPYETITSHLTAASGIEERSSNAANDGVDSVTLLVDSGTVRTLERVDFTAKGAPETLTVLALRSPVVQGDQYTIIDRRYTDTAIDADRDGRPDSIDVAAYARVIGRETVNLPNLPVLQAVRVDTMLMTRVRTSSDGQFSAIQSSLLQTWYVEGIGIVRQRSQVPGSTAAQTEVYDEQLLRWDGQTVGFGAMPEVSAVVPASAGPLGGQVIAGSAASFMAAAIAFDEHALLFAVRESTTAGAGQTLFVSRMDRRGNITAAQNLPTMINVGGKFLRAGNEVAYIEVSSSEQVSEARMTRYTADGTLIGTPLSNRLDLGGQRAGTTQTRLVDAASDGSTLWLLWTRDRPFDAVSSGQLVLGAFSTTGAPLAPEIVVASASANTLGATAALAVRAGKALVTWGLPLAGGGYDRYYGIASAAAGPIDRRLLLSGGTRALLTPLVLDQGGALLWSARLQSGDSLLSSAAGLRLGADWSVIRSTAAGIDTELLPGTSALYRAEGVGNRVVLGSVGAAGITVSWLDAGAGPLVGAPVRSLTAPGGNLLGGALPYAMLTWPDRVIVFSSTTRSSTIPLTSRVYWLNAGTAL